MKKRQVEQITTKLGAEREEGAKHTKVKVRFEGRIVAKYNIRRGSHTDHSFVPSQLHLSKTDAERLAACTMTANEYFGVLREAGRLDPVAAPAGGAQ